MQLYLGSSLIYTSTAGAQADRRWVSSCWRSILCKGFVWALRVDATATREHQTIQSAPPIPRDYLHHHGNAGWPVASGASGTAPHPPNHRFDTSQSTRSNTKNEPTRVPQDLPSGGLPGHPLTPLPFGEQRETMDLVELITMPE